MQILKMLREQKGYISGQELCERLQVSRTAVWKVIEKLKSEGYQIEAVRSRGYRLAAAPDILTNEEIQSLMTTEWAGQKVYCFDEVDSTNIQAKRLAEQGAVHGALIVAQSQSAGRGRRGRSWSSPSGSGIWMSLLLRPSFAPGQASMLTLLMALSAAHAIREKEELNVKIKWPNDIVLRKKKVCGILTEMSAEIDYIHHVVVGIGINANTESFPEEITAATSLRNEKGSNIKRAELIACIMYQFEQNYETFAVEGNLRFIQEEYNQLLVNQDRQVNVVEPAGSFEALALGINEKGELLVQMANGSTRAIFAGEVSVRGIYGYI